MKITYHNNWLPRQSAQMHVLKFKVIIECMI